MVTVAKRAEKQGFTTYMMTSDKDMGQLVSDHIFVFKPGRSGNPPEVWGVTEVCERYGLERPEQVIDILGMMGDSCRPHPRHPGHWRKTAIELVGQCRQCENLIAHAHELKRQTTREL